jgi:Flp pilus assembly protein TadG
MSPTEHRRHGLGRRGLAGLELALILPVLLLLTFAVIDMVVQMRFSYRVERMAGEILNAVAQLDPATASGINAIIDAAPSIGGSGIPVTDTSGLDGAIHVVAVQRVVSNNLPRNGQLWRVSRPSSPPAAVASRISSSQPALPGGVIVPDGTQLVAVEVLSQHRPWTSRITQVLTGGTAPAVLYAIAVGRPRTATLSGSLPP